ncbi:MAG TPA: hypothetical protein VMH20_07455 [Verrucomicrobiae bacterium]|nr:hypothetical protein [Verrucomicrobiae bacterium]
MSVQEDWQALRRREIVQGCRTKKEYCQKVLHCTPRAARYAIAGGNHKRGETVSPETLQRVIHECAKRIFSLDQTKCYQRVVRELWDVAMPRPVITSLDGARVRRISNARAGRFIRKFEWLQSMASGTIVSYGLFVNRELLGVTCFAKNGSKQALRAIHEDTTKVICLVRGACAAHTPKEAPSFLIKAACAQAHQDYGWTHFLAYSDKSASERGYIYQVCGWKPLGASAQGVKKRFISPDGKTVISSYMFNKRFEPRFIALGWDGKEGKYSFLRRLGFSEHEEKPKLRWLWVAA